MNNEDTKTNGWPDFPEYPKCRNRPSIMINSFEVTAPEWMRDIGVRAKVTLWKQGIYTKQQARDALSDGSLQKCRNFGKKSLREVKVALDHQCDVKYKDDWKFDPWTGEPIQADH